MESWSKELGKNDYEILDSIGYGAYGSVLLVRKKYTDENYAMKHISKKNRPSDMISKIKDEVEILSSLAHPYISQFYSSFEEIDRICIIMEYCAYGDLDAYIKDQSENIPEANILNWVIQLSLAIKHIHDKNILHRDIKPANIFLTADKKIKLGDFGLSKTLNTPSEYAETFCGTKQYMSPEMHLGPHYNKKNDIWALGCVLYEMAALKRAFDSKIQEADKGNGYFLYAPIPAKYSKDLGDLIQKILQHDPRFRPTISEILKISFISQKLHPFMTSCDGELFYSQELVSAVFACDASRVRSALQSGADPNTTCSWATVKAGPVLCYAVADEDTDVVKALLEDDKINPDLCGDCKYTPLLDAASKNYVAIAEALLAGGASPDLASGADAWPPLVTAALEGHLEVCRLLLRCGANPDATNKDGGTGIYCAALNGHQDVAQLIIDHGGDPTIKVQDQLTAAQVARIRGHIALANWLDQQRKLPRREAKDLKPHGTYPNETGMVVFLNFFQFSNSQLSNREGAEHDKTNIESTFNSLNYRFECHENLSKSETVTVLKTLSQDKRLWYRDSLLLIISSHGAGGTAFYTSDGGTCKLSEVKQLFTDTNCPQLKNKPKLVISDWDRVKSKKIVDNVSHHMNNLTRNDYFLSDASIINPPTHLGVIFSTSKGFKSFRNAEAGSSFLQYFCVTVKKNPKVDLNILINIISNKMRAQGLPCPSVIYDHPFCKFIF